MAAMTKSAISLPNNAALSRYRRVTVVAGVLVYADANTMELGTLFAQTQTTDAKGAVITTNTEGTQIFVAAGAISAFAPFYAAANGQIAATGTIKLGITLEASTAAGQEIQCLRLSSASARMFVQVAPSSTITNTTVETAFDQNYTIPANMLQAGDRLRIRLQGICPSTNSTDTLTVKLKIGTTIIVATAAVDVANNDIFVVDGEVVIRTAGAGGTFVAAGFESLGTPGTAAVSTFVKGSTAIDTTATQLVSATATWSVANAGDQVRLDVLDIERQAA